MSLQLPTHQAPAAASQALRWTRWMQPAAIAMALTVLAGCGGGGGVDTAPTATASQVARYTEGTLNGFGSIIVNGVRFDESMATISDDSGALRSASALKLGMRLAVDSGAVDASGAARASKVRFGSGIKGPVGAVNAGASTLVVLGQTVDVTSSTIFDDSLASGLAAVAVGAVVEVHGLPDTATGRLVATRIESAAGTSSYKLIGTVASLNTTAKTFGIGAASISYAGAASVPSSLANGLTLRVVLATTAVGGVWQATVLGDGSRSKPSDSTEMHLRGKISAFTSASVFSVNGAQVDASGASFPDGSAGLAVGTEVEVEGVVRNGVLVASKVEIENSHRGDDSRKLELRGVISSIDTSAKTFVLRGVTVSYAGIVGYSKGSAANLVVGAKLRVTGGVGSTRSQLLATAIRFED